MRELCQTINVAFGIALEESRRKKHNPFAAISQKREAVKGEMFRRQIHRRDLQPIRVLGMGQFGEVYLAHQTVRAGAGENGSNYVHRAVKLLRDAATAADRVRLRRRGVEIAVEKALMAAQILVLLC